MTVASIAESEQYRYVAAVIGDGAESTGRMNENGDGLILCDSCWCPGVPVMA